LLACVRDSRATTVLVTAEAGVGKSRVRYEFLRQVWSRDDAPDVWLARGDAFASGSPYGVVGQAVRGAAFIVEGEELELRRKKLRARLGRALAGAELARICDFLGELASVPFDDADSPQLRAARADPKLMADQISRAWEDF